MLRLCWREKKKKHPRLVFHHVDKEGPALFEPLAAARPFKRMTQCLKNDSELRAQFRLCRSIDELSVAGFLGACASVQKVLNDAIYIRRRLSQ